MRKDAFNLSLTTLVLSVFGFFLRWLQNNNAFEPDTGLAVVGAKTSLAFVAFSLVALVLLVLANRLYLARRCVPETDGAAALSCPTVLHKAALWLCSGLVALSCLVMMFTADKAVFPTLQRLTAALGILSAAAFPFVFPGRKAEEGSAMGGIAAIIPILFGCLWMLNTYCANYENPVLWQYVVRMLAVIGATMGFYYLGGYYYNKAKPWRSLVVMQMSVYFCAATLADDHSGMEKLLFAAVALSLLTTQFILIENSKAKE